MAIDQEQETTARAQRVEAGAGAEAGLGANRSMDPPTDAEQNEKEDGHQTSSEESSPPASAKDEVALKSDDEAPIERSRAKVALIMFALGLAVFLAALDITIITTALPTIAGHFQSATGYTWIGSAYLLGVAAATPSWGKISDIWGRKPILLIANVTFLIGSALAGWSVNIGMLIVARAIQGVGGGGLVVLVNICISDLFSIRRRGAYFGIIGGVWAIASSVGPLIGGAFTQSASWRWCFWINLPLDGIAFIIIFLFLDLQTPKTHLIDGLKAIDWLGTATIVGGTLMLLLGLEFGGVSYPWSSPTVICLIVFGVATIVLFGLIEWRLAKYPVIPLRIFKHKSNIASLGVCAFHGYVFIAANYYLPLYFQAVLGTSPVLSGVYILPQALGVSFASIGTGIFIRKSGKYLPPIFFGMALMTLGTGLLIDLDAYSSLAKIILYQVVVGVGIGPNFQAPLIALQSLIHPRDVATATATFGFVRNLSTSISVVIGGKCQVCSFVSHRLISTGVIFQNEIARRGPSLASQLDAQAAQALSGGSAGANVQVIDDLPPEQRRIAREAFADSLMPMWIMYTVFSCLGILTAFLIGRQFLSSEHQETKTGLDGEEELRRETTREATGNVKAEKGAKEKGEGEV